MTNASLSDDDLIRQALAGRQSAHALLVKRYETYVFTLAMRFMKNREDAHEVAQDSFLRAFRYLADFRGECKFSSWLYRIVYTTSLNRLRKQQNNKVVSLDDSEAQWRDEAVPDASWAIEQNDRNTTLREAIQKLSPDDSAIITLFYMYEQSLEEICQVMDLTLTNAKTKLCRARQRLRNVMITKEMYDI